MITYEMLKNLTDEDIAAAPELRPIAKEAEEAAKLIKETWTFKCGQSSRLIEEDEEEGIKWYMRYDGSLRIDVEGYGYCIINCNAGEIFEYIKAEHLYKEDLPCNKENEQLAAMANWCKHFRHFLTVTEAEYCSMS